MRGETLPTEKIPEEPASASEREGYSSIEAPEEKEEAAVDAAAEVEDAAEEEAAPAEEPEQAAKEGEKKEE